MRCPRRDEAYSALVYDGVDRWYDRNGYPHCSYCGSISPEALFAAIADGCELGPTDKGYKVYIDLPEKKPTALRVVSSANFDPKDGISVRVADLPQPLYQLAVTEGYGRAPETTWIRFAPRGAKLHAKFYFMHLSEEEKKKFVGMINDRALNIGYPGHFYRLPFFVGT